MKFNKWTVGLAALGAVSLCSVANAEEKISFVQTAVSGTTISGYVDTSIEWTLCNEPVFSAPFGFSTVTKSGDSVAFGIPFRNADNIKRDGFNLNVVQINISKPLDETPWASGYNVSLLFGPDAVGYNPSANSSGMGDFAIKDANVVLRVPLGNGLDIKIGVFDTVIGYEVFEAGNNPNFTRSWGYAIEPTQHTGVLGTYHVNDSIALSLGVANTLSAGINTRDTSDGTGSYWCKTVMGSITLTAPQSWGWAAGSSFSAGAVYGFDQAISDNRVNVYAGLTIPTPIKGLAVGAAFDYVSFCHDYANTVSSSWGSGGYKNAGYGHSKTYVGKEEADIFILGLYTTWQATEKLSLNVRGEYGQGCFNDSGLSFCGHGSYEPLAWSGYSYDNSLKADIWELTASLQYNLWANVISRAEVRYDEVCPDGGSDLSQLGVYLNFIYKF